MKRCFLALALCLWVFAAAARGQAVRVVDIQGQGDYTSIVEAVEAADDGDIIIVMPGQYDQQINFQGKNITVQSSDPNDIDVIETTIIADPDQPGQTAVVFKGTEGPDCVLTGFTIYGKVIGYDRHEVDYGTRTGATIRSCILQGNCPVVISEFAGRLEQCLIVDNADPRCFSIESLAPRGALSNCFGTIVNCTIANNYRHGLHNVQPGEVFIENSIFYGNGLDGDAQIRLGPDSSARIRYSAIGGPNGIAGDGQIEAELGIMDVEPHFVRMGQWVAGEAGPYLEKGNYRLSSSAGTWDDQQKAWFQAENTSGLIDAGNPAMPTGLARQSVRVNLGAFGATATASKSPPVTFRPADINNDGYVDLYDLAIWSRYWLSDQLYVPADLSRSRRVDFSDFAILTDQWLHRWDE